MAGKRVIVTGACGAVGSALSKHLIENDDVVLGLLDNNEERLFWLNKEFSTHRNYKNIRFILGDLRDERRLMRAFDGADTVYHTAALKHVKLNEENPFEVVKTNILGVENLINACIDCNVSKVIFASSDKAVNPSSSMGASKLLGERLFIAANNFVGCSNIGFSCVRFGNILNSSGSVVPLFRKQLADGKPLTVTHTEMTRYLITMQAAIDLLLYADANMIGGEIFIANMGSAGILDIALALNNGVMPDYKIIGTLPGEKTYEELVTDVELKRTYKHGDYLVVLPDNIEHSINNRTELFAKVYDKKVRFMGDIRSDKVLVSWRELQKWIDA